MIIHQLSLFLENQPGHLSKACRVLADAEVNLLTMSVADTQQFGILRLIVKEWEKARDVLQKAGFVVKVTEVVALEAEDHPGGLADMLDAIEADGINIEYMYAFTFRFGDKAVLVFRFDDPDTAVAALQARGLGVISSVELYSRSE